MAEVKDLLGLALRGVEPRHDDLEAVLRLAGSGDLRRTLGSNARRVATERHSWHENARRLIDAYRRVCSERIA